MYNVIGSQVKWHMIGHLQRNKVKKIVPFADMIETIDSMRLAETVNSQCARIGKVMPVLIEINSGQEAEKAGVYPEQAEELIRQISPLQHIHVSGLMTMGPVTANAEEVRPYFQKTKKLFDEIADIKIPRVSMRYLSMGMSDSYLVAIEEGANMVRIGTALFGPRSK
jgi:pyridoxal phosphate enzyme (YggS family)